MRKSRPSYNSQGACKGADEGKNHKKKKKKLSVFLHSSRRHTTECSLKPNGKREQSVLQRIKI